MDMNIFFEHSCPFMYIRVNKKLFGLERNSKQLEIMKSKELEKCFWGNEF